MKNNIKEIQDKRVEVLLDKYMTSQITAIHLLSKLGILVDAIEAEADKIENYKILTAVGMIRDEISRELPDLEAV